MKNNDFDLKLRVFSNITKLVSSPENPTPLVRCNRINESDNFQIYLKLERFNPFGSVKDRIVLEMLSDLDTKGKKIIEPSSGNTGIALVCVANALGMRTEIVVPEKIPEEKKIMLKFLGAIVREAEDALCPLFPSEGARGLVNALIKSPATKDSYASPNQYENKLNVQAHYKTTGPEIWKQTKGEINYFFAGLGTCGTITGVGRYLKERNKNVKVIGIEPSSIDHNLPGMKRISGLPEDLVPKILDMSVIDEIVEVSDENGYQTAFNLARKEGIPAGPTTGAALHAALQYARSNQGLAVVLSPDDAFKYASFYKHRVADELRVSDLRETDLSGYVCPLSRIKAAERLESLRECETLKLILGDKESLNSIVQEVKNRGLKFDYDLNSENRHVLLIRKH